MPDQTPGTAEYSAAYQAEMDRLDAAAAAAATPAATTTTPDDANTPADAAIVVDTPAVAEPAKEPTDAERYAALEARLTSTEKALNDTKSWASKSAAEVKRLKREQEERDRVANRPQILDDNPGLEEAVRHVTGVPATRQPAHDPDAWADTVGNALPGLDALLTNSPEMRTKAEAKARELGEAWNDPLVAIRELNALQMEHVRNEVAVAAQAAARADHAARQKKQTAMTVPGGSGSNRPAPPVDQAQRFQTMSSADFAKERAKVLGF